MISALPSFVGLRGMPRSAGRECALHWPGGAAQYVRSLIPGALSILKGAVTGRARGLGHTAPTYFRRGPGLVAPNAPAPPHLFSVFRHPGVLGRRPSQPGRLLPAWYLRMRNR